MAAKGRHGLSLVLGKQGCRIFFNFTESITNDINLEFLNAPRLTQLSLGSCNIDKVVTSTSTYYIQNYFEITSLVEKLRQIRGGSFHEGEFCKQLELAKEEKKTGQPPGKK